MRIRVRKALLVIAATALTAGVAAPAMAQPERFPAAGKAAHSTDGGDLSASFKCKKPNKKKLTVSWQSGSISTTIYFNNPCSTKKHIQTWLEIGSTHAGKGPCLTVNPKTKGRKKIHYSPGYAVYDVTSPKKC